MLLASLLLIRTSLALMVYRDTIIGGTIPTVEVVSQVLGCLRLPYDALLKKRLIENLGISADSSRRFNLCSLVDGFGEYDPRAFSLLEVSAQLQLILKFFWVSVMRYGGNSCDILTSLQEAASLGIVKCASFKESPIVVDARNLYIYTAEVSLFLNHHLILLLWWWLFFYKFSILLLLRKLSGYLIWSLK